MKARDLITVCLQNLSRHKARTLLTVLGVIVGCCSVVIMISIGIGMKEAQEKALAQMGDLNIIQVYASGRGAKAAKINKKTIEEMKGLAGVEAITPRLSGDSVPITLFGDSGKRYKAENVTIVGIDLSTAKTMGYKLTQGNWQSGKKDRVYVGQNLAYMFEDTKRPAGNNTVDMYSGQLDEKGMPVTPPPYFDIMKSPLTMELYSGKEDGKKVVQKLEIAGRLKEDFGKGDETSMGMVMSLELYQSLLEQQSRLAGKKWDSRKGYQSALVKVKEIGSVARIEKEVKKMGLRTSSLESIRKPLEQEARQKQMMLGGLGAISLFVAALGITNTMIMSISERTREIGVMKSLGCFVRDVRKIFLLEAGCIGLLGGIAGSVLSYGISLVMNLAAAHGGASASMGMMGDFGDVSDAATRLSVIPWWLTLFAIVFSVAIGVGAGYYPANKAVGIPALEAIKHD